RPLIHRRRNLASSAVPTLLARGSRLTFHATMCRAEGDLEACWNRILTIFDPYMFSTVRVRFGRHRRTPRPVLGRRVTLRVRTRSPLQRRTVGLCQKRL